MQVQKHIGVLLLSALLLVAGCEDHSDSGVEMFFASPPVSLANLNVLHGFDCDPQTPADGDQCRVRERIELMAQHLIAKGCPDMVTLQEIVNKEFVQRSPTEQAGPLDSLVVLIEEQLPRMAARCGFMYSMVYEPFRTANLAETDEELILSRYRVLHSETRVLHSALYDELSGLIFFARHVLHVRIDHPTGPIDVYTTHLSSGSDAASNDCDSFYELVPGTGIGPRIACPAECDSDDTVRACQAEQLALFVEQTRRAGSLALISGDFNAVPGSSEYQSMVRRGWMDSHREAGQAECDPDTGIGCSSGRDARSGELEIPALNVGHRIDYIFVAPPEEDGSCVASLAAGPAGTYRIVEAGLYFSEPNPFADVCGSSPDPMCWVSDHSGNFVQLACES